MKAKDLIFQLLADFIKNAIATTLKMVTKNGLLHIYGVR